MNKEDRQKINKTRLDLLHWVRDNKGESLRYCNKIQLSDRINNAFMPLIIVKGSMPNPPFSKDAKKENVINNNTQI